MATLPIVPNFDVFENRCTSDCAAFPDRITKLSFHRAEEALDAGVVPTLAFAAHTGTHAARFEQIPKIFACILAATIGVKQRSYGRPAIASGSAKRVDYETSINRRIHRPPNHATRCEINNDCEVQPAFAELTTSGFVCNFNDHVTGKLILKNEFEAFGRHIFSLDHPFFALLDKNHRHETQCRFA